MIKIQGAFWSQTQFIEYVEFTDGTVWTADDLKEKASAIYGTEGDDRLAGRVKTYGYSEDETLDGGDGDDILNGNNGNDILIGGRGNDRLNGGQGVDTYLYNRGDGNDIIENHDTTDNRLKDRLVFGEGIREEDIEAKRSGNNLILTDKVTGEYLTVSNAFGSRFDYLENIEFTDGVIWDREDLMEKVSEVYGTSGNDKLSGTGEVYGYKIDETFYAGDGNDTVLGGDGEDIIYGEGGADRISGGRGNDILVGGIGDDILDGGDGTDIYVYNRGDGNDTIDSWDMSAGHIGDKIVFGEGIKPEDIQIDRVSDNMVLTDKATGQAITVLHAYNGQSRYVERIEFADGTGWGLDELKQALSLVQGTDSSDILYSFYSSYGFDGNDTFFMGDGNDVVYSRDGNDTIYGEDGNDSLFGEAGDDVLYGGDGDDYLNGGAGIDTLNGGAGKDYLEGSTGEDSLYGGEGDDQIYGGEGDDFLVGGSGSDYLVGGNGSDTYLYNIGDGDDIINNSYNGPDSVDKLILGANASDVIFTAEGNSLKITLLDEEGSITLQNWFKDSERQNQLYNIETEDGYSIMGNQVELLIQAMASFESTSGLGWQEAARLRNEDFTSVAQQYWMKQVG